MTEYREALEDSQREVLRVGAELRRVQGELRRVQGELRRVQGELRQALEVSARAEQEAEQARDLIESLTSSLSWRVTAPLRATKTRLARRGTQGRS